MENFSGLGLHIAFLQTQKKTAPKKVRFANFVFFAKVQAIDFALSEGCARAALLALNAFVRALWFAELFVVPCFRMRAVYCRALALLPQSKRQQVLLQPIVRFC